MPALACCGRRLQARSNSGRQGSSSIVDLAVYMGTLHAVDKVPYSDHAMVIGEIGLEHECRLLIDSTLRADSSDYRLGQLQLVNHGCAGTLGCNTVSEWVSY